MRSYGALLSSEKEHLSAFMSFAAVRIFSSVSIAAFDSVSFMQGEIIPR